MSTKKITPIIEKKFNGKVFCKYCRNAIDIKDIPENGECPKCTKENSTFINITEKNRNKVRF